MKPEQVFKGFLPQKEPLCTKIQNSPLMTLIYTDQKSSIGPF
jgi:hypothetical protein